MLRLLGFLAITLFYSCQCPTEGVEIIDASKVEKLRKEMPTLAVVDLRTQAEIAQTGRMEGAQIMDISGPDFEKKLGQLDKCKPVMVYCAAGGRSARAAEIMQKKGFSKIYDYTGGMSDWLAQNKPVAR